MGGTSSSSKTQLPLTHELLQLPSVGDGLDAVPLVPVAPFKLKDSQLPLRHLDRMKARGDMRLGLHVNCHPRQSFPFFSLARLQAFSQTAN